MNQLETLKGCHQIFHQLLGQIPVDNLRSHDLNQIKYDFLIKDNELKIYVKIGTDNYFLSLFLFDKSEWKIVNQPIGKFALNILKEIIGNFKMQTTNKELSRNKENSILLSTCESFFRSFYRS